MNVADAVGAPRLRERFMRLVLVALVALTVAVGAIGFSVGQAGAYRSEQVTESVCADLEAGVWYWFEEGQDALRRGDRYGYVIANTFAEWYLDAWIGNGCAG